MSTVIANKWLNVQGIPMNSVLQVVHVDYTTIESTSSKTMVASGFTASITPKFNNSKIFVMCLPCIHGTTNTTAARFRLRRSGPATVYAYYATGTGTTSTANMSGAVYNGGVGSYMTNNSSIYWLDEVNTTSACTYTLEYSHNDNGSAILNRYGAYTDWVGTSHMTLMEIAQ